MPETSELPLTLPHVPPSEARNDRTFTTRLVAVSHWSDVHVIPATCRIPDIHESAPGCRTVWIDSDPHQVPDIIESLRIPVGIADARSAETAIADSRIVAFRAAGEHAPVWLAMCLARGRIPVVIGNAVTLPLCDIVDYTNAVFVLGEQPVELAMLARIHELDDRDLVRMSERCREIWHAYYQPEAVERTVRNTRQLSVNFPPVRSADSIAKCTNPFPAFTADGRLIKEKDLFRTMWLQLGQQFPADGSKPVLCWGAGRFLRRMLDGVRDISNGPDILGVVDDNAAEHQRVDGLPVRKPGAYSPDDFSAVLLTTDSAEDVLASRCRNVYGNDVVLLCPSQLMTITPNLSIGPTMSNAHGETDAGILPHAIKPLVPRKLEAIMVCVGYGDMLSWTLHWNRPQFDNVVVVTSSHDHETQHVAKDNDARLVISDRYNEGDARFNKGKMLNDGFAALDFDDWIVITDADIVFPAGLRRRLMQRLLHPDCLYYATRLDAPIDRLEEWLQAFSRQPDLINTLPFRQPGRNRMPWGYFQLVNASAGIMKNRGNIVYGEEFGTACDVDYAFQQQWPADLKILLPELTVHIPHGAEGTNWRGRQSPPLKSYSAVPS